MKSIILLVGLWSMSCAAAKISTDKLSDPNLSTCDGTKARRKFEFILSGNLKVPSGFRIDKVSPYLEKEKKEYDFLADNWIRYLMAHWYFVTADGKTGTGATSALRFYRDEGLPVGQFSRRYHKAIIRTGDNSFVLCDGELCSGLRDPITGAKIEKDESSSIAMSEKFCRTYYVDGIDPPAENFSKFPIKIEKSCRVDLFSRERFAATTGFKGGTILSIYYYSVPEREQPSVCKSAGLKEDCFKIPATKELEEFGKNAEFEIERPFTKDFIESTCAACLSDNGFDHRNFFHEKISGDPRLKLEWENAVAKDIFINTSVKTTKKVEGDWITYRIDWDPSSFCKYAKDRSDLYTH